MAGSRYLRFQQGQIKGKTYSGKCHKWGGIGTPEHRKDEGGVREEREDPGSL